MNVFVSDEQSVPVDVAALRYLVDVVLEHERYPDQTEVTLMFVTDDVIAGYNDRFMSREGPTDVLAFPLEAHEPGVAPVVRPGDPPVALGDVIVAPDYVSRQASAHGVEFVDEMSLMVVHGLLHLMGWDHDDDQQAEHMEERERSILAQVGVARS
ncbi:MAG: rRNA maturation RNase YbeY [Acidimicrobiia bacterium]|nr:rRNA maturation RNase YbeY [Acidimicrobiia bacterium]